MSDLHSTSSQDFSIELFREGDRSTFKHVYDLYYEVIYTFVYNLVRNEEEAQDLTTDTFIKLWRLRDRFENLSNIKAFLYVTARNASLDHFRKLQRQRALQKEMHYLLDSDSGLGHEVISAEVISELHSRIEQLPGACREIVKMILFENMNTSEIAQKLGISNQTVLNQKAKAISKLSKALLLIELTILVTFILR